ncbi:MAG: CoA-binding protein, partial [Chloroflexota bacterium]
MFPETMRDVNAASRMPYQGRGLRVVQHLTYNGLTMDSRLSDLDAVFYPRSIAIVGASADPSKAGSKWVLGLRAAGFPGRLYPVSTRGGTLAGLNIAPSVSDIYDDIDYVIASVPSQSVLQLIDECIAKKARFIQFFTAGFRETGSPQGAGLEREMLRRAQRAGLRIIGPNCIGSYCPEGRIPLGPSAMGKLGLTGSTGFISQSGGIAAKLVEYGIARDIHFSKGISVGNSLDLDASDFLEYLGHDEQTRA